MFLTIPFTKSLGNAAIFFRLRNPDYYWNWVALTWDVAESANTKLFATESASDQTDSNYAVSNSLPAGEFIIESVLASSGEVIGRDQTTALQASLDNISSIVGQNHYYIESAGIMLASIAPFAAFGNKWFVSKDQGNDNNQGTFESPFATHAKAVSMAVDGGYDVVFTFPATTPYSVPVVLNKAGLLLIGSGGNCSLDPGVGAAAHTVTVTSPNCVVSGFEKIVGRNGHNAIYANGADFIVVQREFCTTDKTAGIDAVVIEESASPVCGPQLSCSDTGRHGLVIKSTIKECHGARVEDVTTHENTGDGIHLEGAEVQHSIICENHSFANGGYGIYVGGSQNLLCDDNTVDDNVAGDYFDATGANIINDGATSALAIMTGAKSLGVDVTTSFDPIVMEQGEKRVIVFEMTDNDGVPVECGDFSFKLGVKEKITDAAYKIGLISGTLSIGSTGKQSLVTWLFTPAMTSGLSPFGGVYEVALYDLAGSNKVPLTSRGGVSFTLRKALIP